MQAHVQNEFTDKLRYSVSLDSGDKETRTGIHCSRMRFKTLAIVYCSIFVSILVCMISISSIEFARMRKRGKR